MHICFLTNEYPQPGIANGGIGTFLKTIGEQLVRSGHRVSVVGHTHLKIKQQKKINNVNLYLFPASKVRGFAWWFNSRSINRLIAEIHLCHPINIVEGAELSLAFIKKIPGIRYIIRLHGGHHFFAEGENRGIDRWKGYQEKRSFKNAEGFIAVSNYVQSHTGKLLSFHGLEPEVIYNAVDLDLFDEVSTTSRSENNIVFVGTVCEKKGIRQLCRALELVLEEFPEIQLHVYGRDWNFSNGESYRAWLTSQLNKSLLEHIHFHGPVEHHELKNIYAQATVCVFPSHSETLGLVAPEAMAMRAPVIFTELGPGPEIIQNGEDGWLVNPHEPKSIAEKLKIALGDKALRKKIGDRGRMRVLKQFDPSVLLRQNIHYYSSLIN
ncbi:glycosyltransferase family 4 protein [Algoriphagus sp.]|uniref:glycosyltransferase family 4 protein n=1 Tax=Algoriphagus sp. TaxID=1872435 RepID=UPI003F718469